MSARPLLPLPLVAAALLALAAVTGADTARAGDAPPVAAGEAVVIEVRVWQHVNDAGNLWVSARPWGGRWDALGTIPLPRSGYGGGHSELSKHRYGVIAIGGVGLRVWQRESEPSSIYVEACTDSCQRWAPSVRLLWWPLGKNLLPLDDGHSTSGRWRYGDLTVAVPRGNPDLLADRERLLALRDVLEGTGAELDWSVGTPTAEWQGVTAGGTPPRVTGLDLRGHGLAGEIWGYLGDLTELTDLRLDGNALTGRIPSKLVPLTKLTRLRLGGNALDGCVPPPLRRVPDHDLDVLGLPDCPDPLWIGSDMTAGTYYLIGFTRFGDLRLSNPPERVVFDVPVGQTLRAEEWGILDHTAHYDAAADTIFDSLALGVSLHDAHDEDTWLFLNAFWGNGELERSHYTGCVYDCGDKESRAALLEQVAASVWINSAPLADHRAHFDEWAWP